MQFHALVKAFHFYWHAQEHPMLGPKSIPYLTQVKGSQHIWLIISSLDLSTSHYESVGFEMI